MSEHTKEMNFQAGRRISSSASNEEPKNELTIAKVIENAEFVEDAEVLQDDIELEPVYKKSKWQTLKGVFVVSFLVLVLLEFAMSLFVTFQQSIILGSVYLTAVLSGVLLIARVIWREYRMLRSLKRNQLHRSEADRLLNSEQVGEALPWLEKLNKHQALTGFENFKQQIASHHTDKEIMTLYADSLLVSQDQQAFLLHVLTCYPKSSL